MRAPFALLLTLLFVSISTLAQTAAVVKPTPSAKPEKVTIKTKVTKEEYADLLKKLKAGDMSIDFARLRLAYTESKDYAPYGGSELRGQMNTAVRDGKYDDAIKSALKMLETNYVDFTAHFIASLSYKNLGKQTEADLHAAILRKLIAAVQENDGLSEKTAMIAIGISEQYFVMSWLGFERQSKALTNADGSTFDVHTSYNKTTKETRKFYFNIDKVFGRF